MGRLDIDTSAQIGRFMVKNTFLDFVGDDGEKSPREQEPCGLRPRSASDPGLYESTFHQELKESMGEQEVIVMSGFSDAETEQEAQPPTPLLPTDVGSDSASTSSTENDEDGVQCGVLGLNHFLEEIRADGHSTSSASSQCSASVCEPQLQSQVGKLAEENARLAEENRLLLESCRQANNAAALATATAYCAPSHFNLSAFSPVGGETCQTWWGNSTEHAGVHQQMLCFAVPVLTQQQAQQQVPQASQPIMHAPRRQARNQKQQRPQAQLQKHPQLEDQTMFQEHNRFEESVEFPDLEKASNDDSPRTTVMLRNLPNNYSRTMLIEMIDWEGFGGQYDFVYLPMDFNTKACLGYAFVNMLSAEAAERFWNTFNGYSRWIIPSRKLCGVSWSNPHQGLQSNLDRYRNSPVMHEVVPEEYKPMLFVNGMPAPFPAPTKNIRVPRIRTISGR